MCALFGKNILEILTTGMYAKDNTIFREYIQNAADSIRKAVQDNIYNIDEDPSIDIELLCDEGNIRIIDNGYGIKKDDVERSLLDIAQSTKNEDEDMGYRGIGRLCGLAYCSKLIFRTSYPGENIETIMEWDAETLRRILDDDNVKITPEEVMDKIVTYSTKPVISESHYFVVEMVGIVSGHENLLNQDLVKTYVVETAPIKFASSFHHCGKIERFAKENSFTIPCYKVTLNGKELSKNYTPTIYKSSGNAYQEHDKIVDVEFNVIKASDGATLAWMWYGISRFNGIIPKGNQMAGIRLRRHNIQVGDDKTIAKFFKEDRGNSYFVGEVYIVHKDLRPNNQRDYVRDVTGPKGQKTIRVEFEESMREICNEVLTPLYREASALNSAYKKENELKRAKEEYKEIESTRGFINSHEKDKQDEKIAKLEKEYVSKQKEIQRIEKKLDGNSPLSKVVEVVKENATVDRKRNEQEIASKNQIQPIKSQQSSKKDGVESKNAPNPNKKSSPFITDQLTNMTENERRIVGIIYGVINEVVTEDKALQLIQLIQDKLKNA